MKDLPHHIKKLNRHVIRSLHREELEEEAYDLLTPPPPQKRLTAKQAKKQAKEREKQKRQTRAPNPPTLEEKNKKMKHRVPIFDRNSQSPKRAKASQKKKPRI